MAEAVYKPMCGLHGVNVVKSEYNKDCKCINCNPALCQACAQYKKLVKEADEKMQLYLERCRSCMNQK